MMMRTRFFWVSFVSLLLVTAPAFAEGTPATPAPRTAKTPRRRAEKHDQIRSAQERGKVHVMDDVLIVGRAQRPMSVFDTNVPRPRFPVGTARYGRDQRFLETAGKEGW